MTTTDLIDRVRSVVATEETVALHEPTLIGAAEEYVVDTIRSGWVSSAGKYVDQFEKALSQLTGVHAVACVNGTSALQVALELAGVQPDEEVLLPALTFVASANAVVHARASPHFVDVDEATMALDADHVRRHVEGTFSTGPDGRLVNRTTGRPLGAVLLVHVFGQPASTTELASLCQELGVPLVEDAAEALGSWDELDRHCGTTGTVGMLSFNGNKIATTGGGGAILTGSSDLARRARHLTTTAKRPHPWEFFHDEVAYNHRMPNLNAALGCAQLEVLDDLLARKAALAERYRRATQGLEGIQFVHARPGTRPNNWLNAIRFDHVEQVVDFLETSNRVGLQTRPIWTPLHRLPMYSASPRGSLPVTEVLAASIVNLPSSAHLQAAQPGPSLRP